MPCVLYDGWTLIFQPESPSALHLLAVLENCPSEVEPLVALPSEPPGWFPNDTQAHILPSEGGGVNRLSWEQRSLPKIFKQVKADILHTASSSPPLFGLPIVVVSPAGYVHSGPYGGWAGRLREALSAGGMARARGLVWPADLPAPETDLRVFTLPPILPAVFQMGISSSALPDSGLDLPETFVVYHGPQSEQDLRHLLKAWTWTAGPIGEYYPLLLVGLGKSGRRLFVRLCEEYGVSETVRALEQASPEQLARVYRECSALFHPAHIPPWGSSVRRALACGKPVVALEEPRTEALVGPAGYLVPEGQARIQGAALITLIIEPVISEQLSQAALERAATWDTSGFPQALLAAYQQALTPSVSP